MEKLFSEFGPANASDWKQQIIKDLKGAPFEILFWDNPNGFRVKPFYTSEDLNETRETLFSHVRWEVCEEIHVIEEKQANARALKALNTGATSLHFVLYRKTDLSILLKDILVQYIELCFIVKYSGEDLIPAFHSYLDAQSIPDEKPRGSICHDGISHLAQSGSWIVSEEVDMRNGNSWIDATAYQNAGATQVFELACAIAHAHEYLMRGDMKRGFRFSMAVSGDFFGEIAKLRALRKLWPLIANEYGAPSDLLLHVRTSQMNKATLDAYNNMLRSTTEGMSAVIGGCNSLTLDSYDKTYEMNGESGQRIARNQQLVLKEESYFGKVSDMGAGSYYIESLTDELAQKAWEEFKKIESKGGFIACLRSNYIQDTITKQARELIEKFREQKIILVGVNKFQNKSESPKTGLHEHTHVTKMEIEPIKPLYLEKHFVKENA